MSAPGCVPRSYDAYLGSFVTDTDLYYLEDAETARRVVELGWGGAGRGIGTRGEQKRLEAEVL